MLKEEPSMKFLVTGATGFIGAPVVANLLQRGLPVVAADLHLDQAVIERLERQPDHGVKPVYVSLDVSKAEDVAAIFAEHPDLSHCIHLAYLMSAEVEANQRRGAEVNIVGMANMFDAVARHKLQRLVFASSETVYGASQAVYGDFNYPVKEDEYCGLQHQFFTYGVMKLLNEFVASKYVQRYGLSLACLRPPVVFGHGRKRGAVLWSEHFASLPAVGQAVTLPFPPQTYDCWIYKDDCAEQFVRLALKAELAHLAYNSGGETLSAQKIAAMVRHWLPRAEIYFEAGHPPTPLVDNLDGTRLREEIDFQPRPVLEGVRLHINEARQEVGLPPV
jgi:nucleoside-diphosphate-sugar epimerase